MTEYQVRLKDARGLGQEFTMTADSDVAAVRDAIEVSGLWNPTLDSVLVVSPGAIPQHPRLTFLETTDTSARIVPTPTPPTVGRIVHYQPLPERESDRYLSSLPTRDGQPWAAIITRVLPDGRVNLALQRPHGMPDERMDLAHPGIYSFAETPTPGHWNWPPR